MEIIYRAKDTRAFNNKIECSLYELWLDSPELDWPEFITNNLSRINEIIHGSTVELKQEEGQPQETDWSKVPEGTWIYVRDSLTEHFTKRKFVRYIEDSSLPFICYEKDDDDYYRIGWEYAQLAES